MAYLIKRHEQNESIIINTYVPPFDQENDLKVVADYLVDALNTSKGTLYVIGDMRALKIKFSDLVVGLAIAYADPNSPFSNPRIKAFTVATDDLLTFGANAVSEQAQYGNAAIKHYLTVEEALKDIQEDISKG